MWVTTGPLLRGRPLYILALKDMWVPVEWLDGCFYPCTRPLAPTAAWGFGDLHSLWYVVREEAMEIVILKCCSDVFSLLYNVSNYNTTSKIHRGVCVLRLTNVHIFHIFTFTVCDISVGMWDHVSGWPGCRSGKCHILSAPLWLICSLLWLHGQNGAKVNLLDLCVPLVVFH